MKRFSFLAAVLTMALAFSSCKNNSDEKTFGLCLVSVENIGADFKASIETLSEDGCRYIPLHKGKIQLQSEAAEVYFKDVLIRQIDEIPAEYAEPLVAGT